MKKKTPTLIHEVDKCCFKDLYKHWGHDIEIIAYQWAVKEISRMTIECRDCNVILLKRGIHE